ncbi:MAG: hypothetical protein ACI3XI_02905 [Eubacteriales bacterium]
MVNNQVMLAPGERLLYQWTYAYEKRKMAFGNRTLAVTNRRIIAKNDLGRIYNHEEILLSDVKNIFGRLAVARIPGLCVFAVVCFLLAIGAIVAQQFLPIDDTLASLMLPIAGVCAFFGLIFLVCFIFIKRVSFALHIDTRRREGERFTVAANQLPGKKPSRRKNAQVTRLLINVDAAREMLEVIGALPYEN